MSANVNGSNGKHEVFDVTIIGAGPSGLFGAFYAGLREMKVKVIDALEELGGQLTALYPEKFIYDVPGYPKVLAMDLVKHLVEQANMFKPTFVLGERVEKLERLPDGTLKLTTNRGEHYSRTPW
jgi:thioredoxin reductase